jgi:hypothetical protein
MNILTKIAWKTRRWNYQFDLCKLYLHDQFGTWGIDLIAIHSNFKTYSLFSIQIRLPNLTTVKKLSVDHIDLFFLRNYLFIVYNRLDDKLLWNPNSIQWYHKILLKFFKHVLK